MALYHAFAMLWSTLWALVLGFGISAALQVLVSREQMTRAFGRAGLREILLATGLGAASSSCSYAAVAAGRSAFQQGAALITVLAFMFASTNLVFELGAVLWLLMGWQFLLAEVIGASSRSGMCILARLFFPIDLEEGASGRIDYGGSGHCLENSTITSMRTRMRRASGRAGECLLDGLADALERNLADS
jgi:hypothetical protein